MKSTGIIRQLDSLGRVVLPIELRRTLDIHTKDLLEILVDGNAIVLKKHQIGCDFCGSDTSLIAFRDKFLCQRCLKDIKAL